MGSPRPPPTSEEENTAVANDTEADGLLPAAAVVLGDPFDEESAHPTAAAAPSASSSGHVSSSRSLLERLTSRRSVASPENAKSRELSVMGDNSHIWGIAKDNTVITSKYTPLTFFPLSLREQFRRLGNVYFLLMGLIMCVGYYTDAFTSSVNPWTTLGPLVVVMSVSLMIEGTADLKRHRSDERVNSTICCVLRKDEAGERADTDDAVPVVTPGGEKYYYEKVPLRSLVAGDVVLVRNREVLPVDLVLLATNGREGVAYIETSSIDGETNLKLRNSAPLPDSFYGDIDQALTPSESLREEEDAVAMATARFVSSALTLSVELPNASVNTFSGRLVIPAAPPSAGDGWGPSIVAVPLDADNLLLRGAALRNTRWALGVAAYCGVDTRLVRNSHPTPSKMSRLDNLINRTILNVLVLMVLCVIGLATRSVRSSGRESYMMWYVGISPDMEKKWPYLPPEYAAPQWSVDSDNFGQKFFTYLTLLNNFVPISLYVTVEIITYWLMRFISYDAKMYHAETNTSAEARSTIVSDLGQVQYVFSDKTGTLTQNIMKFKRCSVDGVVYGEPVGDAGKGSNAEEGGNDSPTRSPRDRAPPAIHHPLVDLLSSGNDPDEIYSPASDLVCNLDDSVTPAPSRLTFNAEMFLRIMCICHTVVVEKSFDAVEPEEPLPPPEKNSVLPSQFFKEKECDASLDGKIRGDQQHLKHDIETPRKSNLSPRTTPLASDPISPALQSASGTQGYEYQAESPDEGALVAASSLFGFRLLSRNAGGVTIAVGSPSIFREPDIARKIQNGSFRPRDLATPGFQRTVVDRGVTEEFWKVLAVNKFDSSRKRMSVLVRSPPDLGSLPMLLCKGADSAMLEHGVCLGDFGALNDSGEYMHDGEPVDGAAVGGEDDNWQTDCNLKLQMDIGIFASEGLRTLVLGVRFLSEGDASAWLTRHTEASASIDGRAEKLYAVAEEIEREMHICGVTAIEDKLQDGVPGTIANLAKAGIKLWVLTGDKKETAIEIGYSTKVLHPDMRLIKVSNRSNLKLRTLVAMEFMRLVKSGKLQDYQKKNLETSKQDPWYGRCWDSIMHNLEFAGTCISRFVTYFMSPFSKKREEIRDGTEEVTEQHLKPSMDPILRKKKVREAAVKIIREYNAKSDRSSRSGDGSTKDAGTNNFELNPVELICANNSEEIELSHEIMETPHVFDRAASARKSIMKNMKAKERSNSITSIDNFSMIDEERLSMSTIDVEKTENTKATIFEKLFSVDRDVRHGNLSKHNTESLGPTSFHEEQSSSQKNAMVIEGSALYSFLGDPVMEEMLFSVASQCSSVIACRVSPKQKAELVGLVHDYVSPTPVTLSIGDGANDVGMIQRAQIGVGISGLEGQQAVNASDFSIAQFRFLETLLLVHGRWNFMRMSKVVLYSFYKNAVLVFIMAIYQEKCFYSGAPVFNQYFIANFNILLAWPIMLTGIFDRDMSKEYVYNNPQVYSSGRDNEYLSVRMKLRWVLITICHFIIVYFLSMSMLGLQGGMTEYPGGFSKSDSGTSPGDSEGGGIVSFGSTMYYTLMFALNYKLMFETGAFIHGKFPWFKCRGKESWPSRFPWTGFGLIVMSFLFFLFFVYIYEHWYDLDPDYFHATPNYLEYRTMTWMTILIVPITAALADFIPKFFSHQFFPSQTQIHQEIDALQGR
mmetsp:Transcript_48061/g.93881  ORF Transcript_48061/g.93881 Transcript_48061/m.93881 type:complete len:1668 (+) Transcript_48061:47-5050(+)